MVSLDYCVGLFVQVNRDGRYTRFDCHGTQTFLVCVCTLCLHAVDLCKSSSDNVGVGLIHQFDREVDGSLDLSRLIGHGVINSLVQLNRFCFFSSFACWQECDLVTLKCLPTCVCLAVLLVLSKPSCVNVL